MSEGINRVTLYGHLAADPELRFTQGGQAVLNMRVATNERYKDRGGEWKERTDYHSVVMWGKRGEGLATFLAKGAAVLVEGSLRTSSYDNKEGQKVYKTEVNATNVIPVGSKRDSAERPARGNGGNPARAPNPDAPADDFDQGGGYGGDDDVPFAYQARGMRP